MEKSHIAVACCSQAGKSQKRWRAWKEALPLQCAQYRSPALRLTMDLNSCAIKLFAAPARHRAISCVSMRYPLALKIISEAIREVFGGDIAAFLQENRELFARCTIYYNSNFSVFPR